MIENSFDSKIILPYLTNTIEIGMTASGLLLRIKHNKNILDAFINTRSRKLQFQVHFIWYDHNNTFSKRLLLLKLVYCCVQNTIVWAPLFTLVFNHLRTRGFAAIKRACCEESHTSSLEWFLLFFIVFINPQVIPIICQFSYKFVSGTPSLEYFGLPCIYFDK